MVLRLLTLVALGTAVLSLGGTVASAHDGPPRLLSAAGRIRPAQTIERAVNLGSQKAILALNGYASGPAQASYWDPLFRDLPDFDHYSVGIDRCSYDSLGSLDADGAALRRCVRGLARDDDYGQIALTGVSMGGSTIFNANGHGLARKDGVVAEVTFDAPLNRSSTAAIVEGAFAIADRLGTRNDLLALTDSWLPVPLDTVAMRDLAARQTPVVPAGVRVVQFQAAGDEVVSTSDSEVPGITVPTLTFSYLRTGAPAHGGQMSQADVRAQAVAVIRG